MPFSFAILKKEEKNDEGTPIDGGNMLRSAQPTRPLRAGNAMYIDHFVVIIFEIKYPI
jgi:hypothetical protein